jgi:hypothetical protein
MDALLAQSFSNCFEGRVVLEVVRKSRGYCASLCLLYRINMFEVTAKVFRFVCIAHFIKFSQNLDFVGI